MLTYPQNIYNNVKSKMPKYLNI